MGGIARDGVFFAHFIFCSMQIFWEKNAYKLTFKILLLIIYLYRDVGSRGNNPLRWKVEGGELYLCPPFLAKSLWKVEFLAWNGKKRNSCPVNQGYEGILVKCLSFFLDSFETCIFDIFYADILRLEWHIKEYFYKHIFNNKGDIQSDNWLNNLDGNLNFFLYL